MKSDVYFKLLKIVLILFIIRVGSYIPIFNLDQRDVELLFNSNSVQLLKNFYTNKIIVLSLFTLSITPYINASTLLQILINFIPTLKEIQKEEGEVGRKKIIVYTRYGTLASSLLQSFSIVLLLKPIIFVSNNLVWLQLILSLVTGSMIILFLCEFISELGLVNGSAIVLTSNIFAGFPYIINNFLHSKNLLIYLIYIFLLFLVYIFINTGTRFLPIISLKQLASDNFTEEIAYLPLKINQGGVFPIICAITLVKFFSIFLSSFFLFMHFDVSSEFFLRIQSVLYNLMNFIAIIIFSILYSNFVVNPKDLMEELNRRAAIIPGIRPGKQTKKFLSKTLKRLSFIGAIAIAFVVNLPNFLGFSSFSVTSLLICVGVALDLCCRIDSLTMLEKL